MAKEYQSIESLVTKNLLSSTSTPSTIKVAHSDDNDGYDYNNDDQKTPTKKLAFHHSNPHSQSWCPNAKCYNSPQCSPCQRRYLFLLATGRSGSTTLLEMFDHLPNVRLSGENYNVVFQTYDLLKRLHDSKNFNKDGNSNNETIVEEEDDYYFMNKGIKNGAFKHHPIPIGSFACVVQHFANALNPPEYELQTKKENSETIAHIKNDKGTSDDDDDNTILGMKEIRLQDQSIISWSPKEAHTFLHENFPCARYIININSRIIRQSKTMKKHLETKVNELKVPEIQEQIKMENEFLKDLSVLLGDQSARLLDAADWQSDVNILNDVVNWLGFEGCKFNTLLHENEGGFKIDKTELDLGDHCRYPERDQ